MTNYDAPLPGLPLTEGEVAVVELVAEGFTNEQIGRWLGMPRYSVHHRLKRITVKLRAANRASVVHRAWRQGYLSHGSDNQ